jgi:phosphonate transport system substrate-binding protein
MRPLLARVALVWLALVSGAAPGQVFSLSVVPQFTPVDIGLRWAPLLTRIEAETGVRLQLTVPDSIPGFEADFLAGVPDFAYLNPYHMVMAAKARGYVPLVRGGEPLRGILVVDRRGPIRSLADLRGKSLAFPSPGAFGASLYLRALLHETEGIAFTPVYVGTHQNVYRHVLLGEAPAGGGLVSTLDREPAAIRSRLRALYTTPGTAPHPIAVHPRVPRAVREKIAQALIGMNRDEAGRRLLAEVELGNALGADYSRDYLPLARLNLDRYLVSDKTQRHASPR